MTAHWRQKERWLNKLGEQWPKSEIWDGSRFAELSWYWDPDSEWLLPVRCPTCCSVVSPKEITKQIPTQQNGLVRYAGIILLCKNSCCYMYTHACMHVHAATFIARSYIITKLN